MKKTQLDILIVDDQVGVRSLLATALGGLSYSIITAVNGEEGIKKAFELHPRLVIMDIKMPIKDGITALYEIKEEMPQTMVVMMTAYGEVEALEEIKRGGAIGYILKPFDIESLIKYVDNLLQQDSTNYASGI